MSIAQGLRLVPVIVLILISCYSTPAQQREEEPRYRLVDGYAVYGYADGREIGYEWFENKDEAEEAKAKMEKVETTTGKYYDKLEIKPERRRIPILRGQKPTPPPNDPPSTKGTKIEFKRPIWVDPGSPKKGKDSVLSGKKGQGKIGDFKVTIEFGADGLFDISGEVNGKGKWQETDSGGVFMETERSRFRGNIKGDKVVGLWFTKDASRPATEWSVDLSAKRYRIQAQFPAHLNSPGWVNVERISGYSEFAGPYTLEDAKAALAKAKQKNAQDLVDFAGSGPYKFEFRIVEK